MIPVIAIIGLGQMGSTYAKYASVLADQVICYDKSKEQRASFIRRVVENENPFDNVQSGRINTETIHIVEELGSLWQQQPVLTIVTTHKDSHCYYACLAMDHGSHVLVEKPLCLDMNEALQIEEKSCHTQKKVYIGFSLHATPAFTQLKEIVARERHKGIQSYEVYRIGEVPEDYMDSVTARFDLLVHDTDFCLQLFNHPINATVDEVGARECIKVWEYPEFEVKMIGKLPVTYPGGFEYGYHLVFQDNSRVEFTSKNKQQLVVKDSQNAVRDIISLENTSTCKTILEKAIHSIHHDHYDDYLSHELSIVQGVNCMNMLINDHHAPFND